ncbi:MAG: hypothetical protein II979_08105, partial [Clostridia bacterium]|nr:hypothetical protein [Clostridia bacterium]
MEYCIHELLQGFVCRVFWENGDAVRLEPVWDNGEWTAAKDGVRLRIGMYREGGSALFSVDLAAEQPLASRALTFGLDLSGADAVLDSHHMGPWWMYCGWPEKTEDLKPKTQNLLLRKGEMHISAVMLTGDLFRCEADGD